MSELIQYDSARFENMERVADYKNYGWSDTKIAKEMGLQRKVVIELYRDYRDLLMNDQQARDIAKDHLYAMGEHYDKLISKLYNLYENMQSEIGVQGLTHLWSAQVANVLKSIAELDAKRLDAYQKAGLLENSELGDELADMEEKTSLLIDILKNDLCDQCRVNVTEKLQRATGMIEVVRAPDG